ncbi:ribonuclease III [Tissierella pigra]|uniref:ribonuclease III n=1 Tax=Tissierella pigra TaxID=2607614 RepID=UPI002DDB296C|nr:ribonuclease III [Tissierella pigra]
MKENNKGFKGLDSLEEILHYKFKDIKLLKKALTHSSYANENKLKVTDNNERLEFLGDTIISLIVSQYLYKKYPNYPEGELTKIRAKVVCESSLAFAAHKMELGKYLLLGKGEESTGGRERESILADATEALVGAIYMDSDFEAVNKLLLKNFEADIVHAVAKGALFIDYKTELQENLQKITRGKIEYKVVKEEGPDHNKIFYMDLIVDDKIVGTGTGRSKKEAEQMAAKEALLVMGEINE